ncbi:hypothetical protein BABINDRAFT_160788 [Babjeviella inositovora NRRL Y-12698]|uniref:PhoD-like phosphatase domain-containing protein n=1 Tax=Babjeviella inositovora NRRL Y-12698 TaxID=984486 RepID=A0A1E3QS41_9ASCO|nr:uncharacterized protein BABINDRAFT_160788 [Babjeviella inositovora NRRL Y-12698]ODQ80515.1 hypothetical protein BABINDRAFT_160788 [Babjeviella inositovora NRRL Y-12698]
MSNMQSDWNGEMPLEEFHAIAKDAAQNTPKEAPTPQPIGSPSLDVRCGPTLRYCGSMENGTNNYRGSILLVVKGETAPSITFALGASRDNSSTTDGEFPATKIYSEEEFNFYRFEISLELQEYEQQIRYAVNGEHRPQYQFYLPSIHQSMNIVSYSCNGFSLGTPPDKFKGSLWHDVLRKHSKLPYHVMIGGGDQIYSDSVKIKCETLKAWTEEHNPIKKHLAGSSPELVAELKHYYLNHYLDWFGTGFWEGLNGTTLQTSFTLAMSLIPSINIFDDHDIIDGFGSYADKTMVSPVFKTVGNVAYKYYMLFQHHTHLDEPVHGSAEPSWILGKAPGPFIEQKSHSTYMRLGKEIGFLGLDCRTERKKHQIVREDTYTLVFQRLQKEVEAAGGAIKHFLVLLGVPIAYPRLVWVEKILNSKLLFPLRKLSQKGIVAKGLVNEFDGSVELLDDLEDHWCSMHHKHERNWFIARLQEFGAANGIRISILSGDVHLCCIGRFKTKLHHHLMQSVKYDERNKMVLNNPENDPRLMFNIISSAIVNGPPPNPMATLLLKRTKVHRYDHSTDEDIIPLFTHDVNGEKRENTLFLNKRNWCDIVPLANHDQRQKEVKEFNVDGVKYLRCIPGPTKGNVDLDINRNPDAKQNENLPAYPLTESSLIVNLHVEKDPEDLESETFDYELVVPELLEKHSLEEVGVKVL